MYYLMLVLFSCTSDDVFTNRPASEYFPSQVGNRWEYFVIDSTGTSEGVKKYSVTVSIAGVKKLADGQDAFVWQCRAPSGDDTVYVRIESDTVKTFTPSYSRTITNLKFPRKIFPIPFQVNQKWSGKLYWIDTYVVSQSSSDAYSIKYHYVGPNIEYNDLFFFTPNIGFTKIDLSHYDLSPVDHQVWQLQRYSLK